LPRRRPPGSSGLPRRRPPEAAGCRGGAARRRAPRLAAEAARKAQEERERQERAEAEARARQRAEQEAREAAGRECRRLEQERLDGRALLANFVAKYGKVEEFKEIAGQITAFLDKARKVKPCRQHEVCKLRCLLGLWLH